MAIIRKNVTCCQAIDNINSSMIMSSSTSITPNKIFNNNFICISYIKVKQPVLLHPILFSSVSHWSRLESLPSQSLSGLGTPLGERMTNLGIQQSFFDYTSIRNYRGHCQAFLRKIYPNSAWLPRFFPALCPLTQPAKQEIFAFVLRATISIILHTFAHYYTRIYYAHRW